MIARIAHASVAARRPVLAATLVFAIAAAFVGSRLRFDALPDITGVQVQVLTRAPGMTPEEVEVRVTRPIELAVSGVPGVREQRSLSRYGISSVTIVFDRDADLVRARQLVAERIASAREAFPPGVEAPELGPMSGGLGEVFQFVVRSSSRPLPELLEVVEQRLAPQIRSVGGIVEVNPWGGARRTLDVVGDPSSMARRGVTLAELHRATERAVGSAPGAAVSLGASQALLRGRSLPTQPSELAAAWITRDDRPRVRIGEVARVEEGALPRIGAGTLDGRGEVVYVMCQMLSGANALEVMDRLHAIQPELERSLPDDVELVLIYDRSALVHATLRTVATSLFEGGILVALVLLVALGSVRAAGIVASVIPLAMVGATVWMVAFDLPGNLMSLGALDFGLLVDGAVVVVEASFHELARRRARGDVLSETMMRTVIAEATAEVARPVAYSVLIIGLVYVPILALGGVEGVMFRPMALTVLFALATSLVLGLTFVPAALTATLRPHHVPQDEPRVVRWIHARYAALLAWTQPKVGLHAMVLVLGLTLGGVLFLQAGTEFIPTLDEGDLVLQTTSFPSTSLEAQVTTAARVESAIRGLPEVRHVAHRIGSPSVATDVMGLEQSDVFIAMRPRSEWTRPRDEVVEDLIERVHAVAPNLDLGVTHPIQMRFNELLGGTTSDVALELRGDDLGELSRLGEDAVRRIESVPGAVDVRLTMPPGVPLLDLQPRPLELAQLGLDATDLLEVTRALRMGLEAGVTQDGPRRVPVRVRLDTFGGYPGLGRTPIPVGGGRVVELSRLASLHTVDTPSLVDHSEGRRRATVAFNVRGRDLGGVMADARAAIERGLVLPETTTLAWRGQFERLEEARRRLLLVVPLVLVAILVLLRSALGRWQSALLVFANVPFAAVGGMMLLALRGLPISISAAVGFIALAGIAVMNGVVLVAQIHSEESSGASAPDAALRAALSRMRPVLMTAAVAGLGFVPMMLSRGVGAEVQAPLATVVVGGLVTSTLLTLVVLPSTYAWLGRGRA